MIAKRELKLSVFLLEASVITYRALIFHLVSSELIKLT